MQPFRWEEKGNSHRNFHPNKSWLESRLIITHDITKEGGLVIPGAWWQHHVRMRPTSKLFAQSLLRRRSDGGLNGSCNHWEDSFHLRQVPLGVSALKIWTIKFLDVEVSSKEFSTLEISIREFPTLKVSASHRDPILGRLDLRGLRLGGSTISNNLIGRWPTTQYYWRNRHLVKADQARVGFWYLINIFNGRIGLGSIVK